MKSAEIEEKINSLEWLNVGRAPLQLLTTNDNVVKLWRISNTPRKELTGTCESLSKGGAIKFPRSSEIEQDFTAKTRKQFRNAHNYHINSLSVACDGEHFLSADDLRVNIWNVEQSKETFSVVDIKPPNIDDLSEVITHAEFHP